LKADLNGVQQPSSPSAGAWHWLIFALGLGLFLYFQVGLVAGPFRVRDLPVESDDAYSYICKSAELLACPTQDCPALNDLRSQMTPAPDDPEALADQKWRRHARLYTNYHPLYSLALWALAKTRGISYEETFRQLGILGSLGLGLALSYFLVTLAGPMAAGISLACLAPLVFPGQDIVLQGIYYIAPSPLSMGVGLLMFAYLARRQGRPGLAFYGLNCLAMGLHPMGLIYTGLAVVFGMACRYPRDRWLGLWAFVPSLALMAGYWGVTHRLRPFTMLPVPVYHSYNYLGEVLGNLAKVAFYLRVFLLESGWPRSLFFWDRAPWLVGVTQVLGIGLGLAGLRLRAGQARTLFLWAAVLLLIPSLITLGVAVLLLLMLFRGLLDVEPGRPRLPLLIVAVLFLGMLASCFYVLYPYSDTILDRAYVFWALGAVAIFGRGVMLMATAPGLGPVLPRYVPAALENWLPSRPWVWRALLLVFVVFCLFPQQARDYTFRGNVFQASVYRYDMAMDDSQPRLVLARTSPGDVILYDRDDMEVILPHFLTHGCLSRRAVFLPYLPLSPGLALDPERVKFLVGMNPFLSLSQPLKDYLGKDPLDSSVTLKNYLALPPGATITLQLDADFKPETLEILNLPGNLASPGERLLLTRESAGETKTWEEALPAGVWRASPLPPYQGGSLSLRNPDKDRTVAMGGLRFKPGNDAAWQWPWRGVAKASWEDPSTSQSRSFPPPKEITFQGRTYRLAMQKDGGASVVWELTPLTPGH
jgi:hypothetical protein